ncbi:SDR family oxidoreductase [Shewanella sp. Scap07]|uniref:SDR family oxidoreductase n=1 Tax=Shewanella sp. Scap07 TaxID=2589987 RepID=UPI0015B8AFF8|nr:SDR family oxidoreductase [Shewanella sp. Scap07]QLE85607.1 SDR family oxidoreductase [Shewanella sp. Scap07]
MTKHVLITGANRGIGLAFVNHYLAQGFKVTACCRKTDTEDSLHQLLERYSSLNIQTLDVTSQQSISALSAKLSDSDIDLLINNAGFYGPKGMPLGQTDVTQWLKVLQVNTVAPLMVVEGLMTKLNQRQATIVCMSSKMGSMADNSSGGAYIYRSSKAGLNAVVKSLALDLKPKNITCVSLHPGWVQTDMGGPNALISVNESVQGMIQVIENLSIDQTGKFFNYDGSAIDW